MGHDHGHSKENKTIISFTNAFWLVVIIVGLFIGALNFIKAEGNDEEGKGEGAEKTEMKATEPAGEKAETKAEAPKAAEAAPAAPAADTTKK
jgi:hypothetical protein